MARNRSRHPGRQSRSLLAALAVTSLCAAPAVGQLAGKGGINGRVTDASGAVIPDADVQVLQAGTNLKQETHTTGAGDYSFSVDAGKYTVIVTHDGFRSVRQENVPIDALQTVEVNVTLQTGQVNEEITVTDAPPLLETSNATIGATIEQEQYSALPLIEDGGGQRRATDFAQLLPV